MFKAKSKYGFFISICIAAILGALIGAGSFSNQKSTEAIAEEASVETYRQLDLFGDVFNRVRKDYVEKQEDQKLLTAAIKGMLSSLDPHSSYLSPNDFKKMQVSSRGEFGGLGIEVIEENGYVKVVTPIDGTPAAEAGLMTNDLIIALDGKPTKEISMDDAIATMRGKVSTKIVVTIKRGKLKPFDVEIIRDVIKLVAVRGRIERGNIGYMRITSFSDQTTKDVQEIYEDLTDKAGDNGLAGLVLDLRNNPGGLLEQAISVSDSFIKGGEIVSTRGRKLSDTQRFFARSSTIVDNLPLIILINGGTASAAEIVAGALQDHKKATVLGTRSFGKGSVQKIIPLKRDGGAIRLTISRYYTPSGKSIQAKGIIPDIRVDQKLSKEEASKYEIKGEVGLEKHLKNEAEQESNSASSAYVPKDAKDDTQLQKALDLIQSGSKLLKVAGI